MCTNENYFDQEFTRNQRGLSKYFPPFRYQQLGIKKRGYKEIIKLVVAKAGSVLAEVYY